MYTVDNKFEVGEECYTVCRETTKYKCPFCEGKGKKEYNGMNFLKIINGYIYIILSH